MVWLITEIFFMVAFAAAGGAALTFWWLRRRYQDVTEDMERLRASREPPSLEPVLEAVRRQPAVDLSPVLEAVRELPSPATDLSPVLEALDDLAGRVTALERALPAGADDLAARVTALERSVSPEAEAPPAAVSNLLEAPEHGPPDDLKKIRGVGPKLESLLHEVGVFYFWQIADWSDADVRAVDARLGAFKGRVERDGWVEQARALRVAGPPPAGRGEAAAPSADDTGTEAAPEASFEPSSALAPDADADGPDPASEANGAATDEGEADEDAITPPSPGA